MKKEDLAKLVHRLNTQDNRSIADPIYVVEEEGTIYGVSQSYTDETIWLDRRKNAEDGGAYDTLEDVRQYLGEMKEMNAADAETAGFERIGVTKHWRLVNVHLTDVAAEEYIQCNAHRHSGRLRSYVPIQYRCYEINALIEALKNGELVLKEEA